MYQLSNIARATLSGLDRIYTAIYFSHNSIYDSVLSSIDRILLITDTNIDTNIDIIIAYGDTNIPIHNYESLCIQYHCPIIFLDDKSKVYNSHNMHSFISPDSGINIGYSIDNACREKHLLYILDKDPVNNSMVLNFLKNRGGKFDVLNLDKFITINTETVYKILNQYEFVLHNTHDSNLVAAHLAGCVPLTFNSSLAKSFPECQLITEQSFEEITKKYSAPKIIAQNNTSKLYETNILNFISNLIDKPFIL